MREQAGTSARKREGPADGDSFWRALDAVPLPIWQEDWTEVLAALRRLTDEGGPGGPELASYLKARPDTVVRLLGRARLIGANSFALATFGKRAPGQPATYLRRALASPDSLETVACALVAAVKGQPSLKGELTLRTRRGEFLHGLLDLNLAGVRTNGVVFAVLSDITDRRLSEETLRAERDFSASLLDSLPGVFYLYDEEGHFLRWNQEFLRVSGYSEEEMRERRPVDFFAPEERPLVEERIREVFTTGSSSVEADFVTKDGTRIPYFFTGLRRRYGDKDCLLGIGLDLSRVKRAEEADRLKSAFLATMSHELRTPLNSIIGFTGVLLQGLAGPLNAEQTKQLTMVQNSARHLLALINDVLDLSKIEAGEFVVEQVSFPVRRVVERVVDSLRPTAEKKGLCLEVEIPADPGEVASDERRVQQILLNLMGNAVKFTEKGGVRLRVEEVDRPIPAVRFVVQDTGPGIRQADLATLFRPFRQLEGGLSRKHEGTGLGLAICKRLADLLGAELTVSSELGRGSAFSFTLPRHKEGAR